MYPNPSGKVHWYLPSIEEKAPDEKNTVLASAADRIILLIFIINPYL